MANGAERTTDGTNGGSDTRTGTGANALLDADFLRKLERLSVASRRPFPGRMRGEKRSTKRGQSVEFADYRDYTPGDDLRYVDWKAYARLERLFVKLFVEEEDLTVHLLVDASQSMGYAGPEPGDALAAAASDAAGGLTKFDYARKVAAALGYVGLARYDRVQVAGFGQTVGRRVPVLRGRGAAPELFSYLGELRPGGGTDFAHALRHYAARAVGPGVCVVLSDFYDPDWTRGVRALLSRRFQVVLLQILTPSELSPNLLGDLRLVDSETGEAREISVTPELLERYRVAVDLFCAKIAEEAGKLGMDYLRATTDAPFEDLLLKTLRGAGLLRGG